MRLSGHEQQVCAAIAQRGDTLLDDLASLVAIPTGLCHTAGLDETRGRIVRRLAALSATTTLKEGAPKEAWLYGSEPLGEPPPTVICSRLRANLATVLLSGHLDTVHDPRSDFRTLTLSADGRTATGPGCVDMKGGLVIALHALEALDEAGINASWGFVLNSDEESGSFHSDAILRDEAGSGYAAGLALEPAMPDGGLVIERPGSGQFMLEAGGRAAHVGRDFASGVSAVTALAGAVLDASALAQPAAGRIVNVGPLEGGVAANVVPDRARAWGNVRFTDEAAGHSLAKDLERLSTGPYVLPSLAVRHSFNRPAKPVTPAVLELAHKARQAAEDLGQTLPFGKTGGVCDGNNLQAAGLPTIDTLGVRGGGLHTPQEWVEVASLVERCQLLAVLISRLCEGR